MQGSFGGKYPEGNYLRNSMEIVREFFMQKTCRSCLRYFCCEDVEFVREEQGTMVVKVTCGSCGNPLGIALVGLKQPVAQAGDAMPPQARTEAFSGNRYPYGWTAADAKRLSGAPVISYDDVLDAHSFFSCLDENWLEKIPGNLLPARRRLQSRRLQNSTQKAEKNIVKKSTKNTV